MLNIKPDQPIISVEYIYWQKITFNTQRQFRTFIHILFVWVTSTFFQAISIAYNIWIYIGYIWNFLQLLWYKGLQHTLLCCTHWISFPKLTAEVTGIWSRNSPHYKPHLHTTPKVSDIIHPCHLRALQSEHNCMCYSDGEGNRSNAWFTPFSGYFHMWATLWHIGVKLME